MGQELPPFQSPQGLDGRAIVLDDGDSVVITFNKSIHWDRGGVSWTIGASDPDAMAPVFSVAVDHSLNTEGDDWVPDPAGPFTKGSCGVEEYRISRIRFTNTGDSAKVVMLAPTTIDVELS